MLLWWSTGDGLPIIALPALAAMGALLLGCALCGRGLRYGHVYLACCALRLLHVLCLLPGMVAGRGSRYHVIGLAIEQMNAMLPLWVGWCNAALLPVSRVCVGLCGCGSLGNDVWEPVKSHKHMSSN